MEGTMLNMIKMEGNLNAPMDNKEDKGEQWFRLVC
jgi:hypothetical protein